MKTFLLTIVAVLTSLLLNAGDLKTVNKVLLAQEFDVAKLTQEITGKLISKLALAKEQQPKVTSAVANYLVEKSKIIKADKDTYTQKQQLLFNGFKSKISGVLLQNQMNAFMGLKPAASETDNVLTQLFY